VTVPARELFDPAFVASLEGLRILARSVPRGGQHGEQRSRARGAGAEFADVRPYAPGDDFRRIDPQLWLRLDKLFLRLYLEEQDLPVHFLLDQSASMAPRTKAARQAVAALGYVALNHLDRVAVHPFAGAPLQPLPGASGHGGFQRLLGYLARLPVEGRTGMVEAVRAFAARNVRRGLCVVVSDFFDPRGVDEVLAPLRALRHRLCLLRPVLPDEARPLLQGELELVDAETDERLQLSVDDALLARHEAAYREFEGKLERFARAREAGLLALRAEAPVVPQLAALFEAGVLRA
jgi:uncharacterized protein (DUF58 family)